MKAGAFTPATPAAANLTPMLEDDRSMKAGAFTPATRGAEKARKKLDSRSMKAEAFTPATRSPQ